ncbi:MAG: DUF4405 domain-containing protein [Alphaproteobacteria bacterium]|nr:DUF4405 domain-containing protein [Alphaproteobacteria bacterium]
MRNFLNLYSTPITVALFAVAVVTGVPIFFHIGDRFLKGAHEWLSLAFVAAVLLHLARHWRGFAVLIKQRRTHVLLVAGGLAMAAFVAPAVTGSGRGGNPMMALAGKMVEAPLVQLAPALGVEASVLVQRLEAGGISQADPAWSAAAIAAANGKPVQHVAQLLMAESRR